VPLAQLGRWLDVRSNRRVDLGTPLADHGVDDGATGRLLTPDGNHLLDMSANGPHRYATNAGLFAKMLTLYAISRSVGTKMADPSAIVAIPHANKHRTHDFLVEPSQ